MSFPETHPRRLRRSAALRRLVRETTLDAGNFIFPMFVCPGNGVRREISSLPGQFHFSVDQAVREAEEVAALGIPAVILFGLPKKKDEVGSEEISRRTPLPGQTNIGKMKFPAARVVSRTRRRKAADRRRR